MRILFCGDSFPGHFSALASALASQGHEVLFASHYGRRDFALPGVHRVLLKPVRERSPLKRTLTSARQAHAAFLSLRDAGLAPDAVLFSASSAIPLWAHKAFPKAMLFGYADSAVLLADPSPSEQAVPGEEEQAAMLRSSALAHCHAIFAFSEQCLAGLPPLMARNARVLPAFIDTDFFSPDSAKPFACAGRVFPQDGELVAMDIRPHRGEDSLAPRALWELALGLLAHRPHCTVLLNCANAELKEASQDLAKRLPESWQSRLAVQGYSSLEGWRDMLAASARPLHHCRGRRPAGGSGSHGLRRVRGIPLPARAGEGGFRPGHAGTGAGFCGKEISPGVRAPGFPKERTFPEEGHPRDYSRTLFPRTEAPLPHGRADGPLPGTSPWSRLAARAERNTS